MDIKQNVPPTGGTTSQQKKSNEEFLTSHLLVRTMEKDMAALSKNSHLVSLSPKGIPLTKPAAPQPFLPPKIVAPPTMDATKKIIPPLDLPIVKDEVKPVAPTIPLTPKPAPPPPPSPPSLSTSALAPKSPAQKPLPPPLILPVLPTTALPEPGRKMAWGKIALIAGLLIIISLGVGGWIYWQNFQPGPTTSATPSSTPSATPTPLVLPSPLFSMDEQRVIELAGAQKTNPNEIAQIFSPLKEESVFAQIIFETSANRQKKIPTLSELSALVGFESFALSLADYLQPEKYSFFVYSQTATSSSPFSGGQQGRLGFVVALQDAQKAEELSQKLKELETLIPTNLKGLLADKNVQLPDIISFLDNTYKNIPIRYINFPTAVLSIDYALVNDMFVVATSKESMYAAIDRLLTAAASTTKGDQLDEAANGICKYEDIEAVCNQLIVQFPYGLPDEKIKEVETIINANDGKIIERYSPEIPGFTVEIKPEEKLMNLKKILGQSEVVANVGYNMILDIDN